MKKAILILLLLFSELYCYAQPPYFFTDYPINDPGVIQNSDPKNFCVFNNKLFFCAYGGHYGDELWSTDGSLSGTYLVKDINTNKPNTYGFGSYPAGFTEINGKLVFAATTDSLGRELWITDGTTTGTMLLKDIYSGTGPSNPGDFIKLGSNVLFTAQTAANGKELWITDGTTAGTQLLKDIKPGTNTISLGYLTEFDGKIYFQAEDGTNGAELWVTDGTTTGTHMLTDITADNGSSNPSSLTVMNAKLYFYATTTQYGTELWVTDGTAAGTHIVKDIYPGYKSALSSNSENPLPVKFAVYSNKLYFSALDSIHGYELWCTDGTNTGTYLLKDINSGLGNSYSVKQYIVYKGKLYFSAYDTAHGSELWVTDGTNAGTQMVVDFAPGSYRSVPGYFTLFADHIYYSARQSTTDQFDFQLVQTDGTASGTKIISCPKATWARPLEETYEFIVYDSTLFFSAGYDNHGVELWSMKDTTGSFKPEPPSENGNNSDISIIMTPNPNYGIFTLECNNEKFIGSSLSIYNTNGKKIYQGTSNSKKILIDISGATPGEYLIKLRIEGKAFVKRTIIF